MRVGYEVQDLDVAKAQRERQKEIQQVAKDARKSRPDVNWKSNERHARHPVRASYKEVLLSGNQPANNREHYERTKLGTSHLNYLRRHALKNKEQATGSIKTGSGDYDVTMTYNKDLDRRKGTIQGDGVVLQDGKVPRTQGGRIRADYMTTDNAPRKENKPFKYVPYSATANNPGDNKKKLAEWKKTAKPGMIPPAPMPPPRRRRN